MLKVECDSRSVPEVIVLPRVGLQFQLKKEHAGTYIYTNHCTYTTTVAILPICADTIMYDNYNHYYYYVGGVSGGATGGSLPQSCRQTVLWKGYGPHECYPVSVY